MSLSHMPCLTFNRVLHLCRANLIKLNPFRIDIIYSCNDLFRLSIPNDKLHSFYQLAIKPTLTTIILIFEMLRQLIVKDQ